MQHWDNPRIMQIKPLEADSQDGRPTLNGYGLHCGESFRALFPNGWKQITLEVRCDQGGRTQWYISTPGFKDVCPIGLFVII